MKLLPYSYLLPLFLSGGLAAQNVQPTEYAGV